MTSRRKDEVIDNDPVILLVYLRFLAYYLHAYLHKTTETDVVKQNSVFINHLTHDASGTFAITIPHKQKKKKIASRKYVNLRANL